MREILNPLLAWLDRARNRRLQYKGMAVHIAVGMTFRLAAHIMGRLEIHRFRDRKHAAFRAGRRG